MYLRNETHVPTLKIAIYTNIQKTCTQTPKPLHTTITNKIAYSPANSIEKLVNVPDRLRQSADPLMSSMARSSQRAHHIETCVTHGATDTLSARPSVPPSQAERPLTPPRSASRTLATRPANSETLWLIFIREK